MAAPPPPLSVCAVHVERSVLQGAIYVIIYSPPQPSPLPHLIQSKSQPFLSDTRIISIRPFRCPRIYYTACNHIIETSALHIIHISPERSLSMGFITSRKLISLS